MTDENQDTVFNDLWELQIPTKAAFFAWRIIQDRLPTKTNLHRRNVEINDSMCPFCRNFEEDAAHLFFSCDKVMPLWWESLSWINAVAPLPQNPRHTISSTFLLQAVGYQEAALAELVDIPNQEHLAP